MCNYPYQHVMCLIHVCFIRWIRNIVYVHYNYVPCPEQLHMYEHAAEWRSNKIPPGRERWLAKLLPSFSKSYHAVTLHILNLDIIILPWKCNRHFDLENRSYVIISLRVRQINPQDKCMKRLRSAANWHILIDVCWAVIVNLAVMKTVLLSGQLIHEDIIFEKRNADDPW